MGSQQARRTLIFAAAVAVLALGALAIELSGKGSSEPSRRSTALLRASQGRPSRGPLSRSAEGAPRARQIAARFARAYLLYERGALGTSARRAISRLAAPRLAAELLRAPARAPPGARAPSERLVGVGAARLALLEGKPALIVAVTFAGPGGRHQLEVRIERRAAGLAVAGIGP